MPNIKRTIYAVKSGDSVLNWFDKFEVARDYARLYDNTTVEQHEEYEPEVRQVWNKADEPDNLPV